MRIDTTVLLAASAALCACRTDLATSIERLEVGAPVGPVTLVREARWSGRGGYDLFRPARPIAINNALWVLESGNDQLVRFDSTLQAATSFGREGEGPGEIQFALDLLLDRDRFVVAEAGNGRLSVFDTTGLFRSILATDLSPRFVAAPGGHLVLTPHLPEGDVYAYRVDEKGRLRPHATISSEIRRLAASDPSLYLPAGAYIAGSPHGELIVLDQSVLALSRYDPAGRLVGVRLLPEPFRSSLLSQRVADRRSFGARASAFIDSPAAKRISMDAQGRLLVLFPLPDSWGLLVDPGSWTARPLLLPDDRRVHDLLWAASDASLSGERLYVVSGSQLYQFRVEGW